VPTKQVSIGEPNVPSLPELIVDLDWMFSHPIDLKNLRKDIWAWATVPNIKGVLHKLLSVLEKHNAYSTFFVSGSCARQNKAEIVKIKNTGHEIGLHGYKHVPYNMPYPQMMNDLRQSLSVFSELGVSPKGFRAPWLISTEDTYRAGQKLGLQYMSNFKEKSGPQKTQGYNLVELPIYIDDETLIGENAVPTLLEAAEPGRVFEFHLLYVRQNMRVLDEFLRKLKIDTATLSQIAQGAPAIGLSFDIAYLDRIELAKKLFI
jgi:peptidoglycan/xylan/chitin deacetylase (PgdA/CDA1 family)